MKQKLFILAWLISVLVGVGAMALRSATPGAQAAVSRWPSTSSLVTSEHNLIVFMHPGCACSQATLSELSRLLARHPQLTSTIVFMQAKKLQALLKENKLLERSRSLPRTTIAFDHDGMEAQLFGAKTSGHAVLYNGQDLIFSGGLTAARGHEGKSQGQDLISHYLTTKTKGRWMASVFGCDLFGETK